MDHMKIHDEKKPYDCKLWGKLFLNIYFEMWKLSFPYQKSPINIDAESSRQRGSVDSSMGMN